MVRHYSYFMCVRPLFANVIELPCSDGCDSERMELTSLIIIIGSLESLAVIVN